VRLDAVVAAAPSLDEHLSLFQAVEDLAVKQLVPNLAIDGLVVAVLSRAVLLAAEAAPLGSRSALSYVEDLDAQPLEPAPDCLSRELIAVVRADMIRRAVPDKELRQNPQDIVCPEAPSD
jgi:hypothetical protein